MPSKKKARCKARRVVKTGKEAEEDAAACNEVKNELGSQMQRLQITNDNPNDDDALLEQAIKLAASEKGELEATARNDEVNNTVQCYHGFVLLAKGDVCQTFVKSFIDEFDVGCKKSSNLIGGFENVYETMKTKYAEVWNDPDKVKVVASSFLCDGTNLILEGKCDLARCVAMYASFLEQWVAITIHKTQASCDWGKLAELFTADEHTLASFFRKRVPCKCLDKKYKEVKSITKMGICGNPKCSLPDRKAERSRMLYCTRCCAMNYCSRECQVADWAFHKEGCDIDASRLAALKTRQNK